MKRLICAVALLVLAGCTSVPSVPTPLQTQRAAIKASGGPFNVTESGNYTLSGCNPPYNGNFAFSGSGSGTFIHRNNEGGTMIGDANTGCPWSGNVKLINALHPRNTISMSLILGKPPLGHNDPCNPGGFQHIMFTVTGGTGRFAHATGSGVLEFACNSNGTYTDQWSGTITF